MPPRSRSKPPSHSVTSAPALPASIETVVPKGDRRASLVAIRDRLAVETSDTLWNKHKDECHCTCGMGDGRVLVALVKELRGVIAEIESLPKAPSEESAVDRARAASAARRDDLAARRAARPAGAPAS